MSSNDDFINDKSNSKNKRIRTNDSDTKINDPFSLILGQILGEALKQSVNNDEQNKIIPLDIKIETFDKDGKINSESSINFNNLKNKNNTKSEKSIIQIKKIDYYSSIGDLKYLDEWLKSIVDSDNKIKVDKLDDYSSEAIDNASYNGHIDSLDWWLNVSKKNNVYLKYTEKAIDMASKFGKVEVLDWWINSGLELKYSQNAINYASNSCKLDTLDWWLENSKKGKVEFLYSENAINNSKIDENKLFKLVRWWKSTIDSNNLIMFKYSKEFIEYLESWNYHELFNYLKENKMIKDDDKFNNKQKNSNIISFFDLLGLSDSSPTKKQKDNKNDFSDLPEDIQKHIKEKEEELNNNMLINGKVKEYIDNLVKIPFGKYKIEKIFIFVQKLIKRINTISDNNLLNESDLIKFFKNTNDEKFKIYKDIYSDFCKFRIDYLKFVDNILDDTVYGHVSTKKHIKCIITQWLSGGFKCGVVIGIQGPPGVGKTTIIKGALSKCLVDFIDFDLDCDNPYIKLDNDYNKTRPFSFMSLGGTTNGSTLAGHNITYHGATSGDIVKHLKEAKVMNPILYFDELDKISNTEHGHEISSILTHITDPVQNEHFTDRYFSEVKIDLSKCIIVFSYNDSSKIDRILLDRIQEIRLSAIKHKEKIVICKKFIIPEICSKLGYNVNDIEITDDKLDLIISEYTLEAGIRKLKEKLYEVFRTYHMKQIIDNTNDSSNKIINADFINDTFSDYPTVSFKKIGSKNQIGCINGLFASTTGVGGITPIQVKQIYHKESLGINITGSVEKVMSESIQIAKSVAWSLLTKEEQEKVIKDFENRGLHIHFPDGSTSKDGPSGGTAITCSIYSLFANKPIKNNVAITGEIDLNGNVLQIGGLDAKLTGAKRAGVSLVLVPTENKRDIAIIRKNNPELFKTKFKVKLISHVSEALDNIF